MIIHKNGPRAAIIIGTQWWNAQQLDLTPLWVVGKGDGTGPTMHMPCFDAVVAYCRQAAR